MVCIADGDTLKTRFGNGTSVLRIRRLRMYPLQAEARPNDISPTARTLMGVAFSLGFWQAKIELRCRFR